ncbi:putative phage abortive infection protein [Oleidesulfovibrio alaskensis]|uniref:putative phage abortive infection protein n=1 Tax=Oleidesulfovibrio alaskensis TaxID=58180 RepID=UPI00138AF213
MTGKLTTEEVFSDYFQCRTTYYYRHLYHTLKYICTARYGLIDKNKYFGILRAQLSTFEMLLLYYHALASDDVKEGCDKNIPKFQCYIEESALLHCLETSYLFGEGKAGEYDPKAFGEESSNSCARGCEH